MSEIIEEIAKLQAQNPALTVSIVGSGGKTTLMKQLAEKLAGPVLCTTSTKLGVEQALYFDQHIVWNETEKKPQACFLKMQKHLNFQWNYRRFKPSTHQ